MTRNKSVLQPQKVAILYIDRCNARHSPGRFVIPYRQIVPKLIFLLKLADDDPFNAYQLGANRIFLQNQQYEVNNNMLSQYDFLVM